MSNDVIYALQCPVTGETRYIGVTMDMAARFRSHVVECRVGNHYRANWWRKVEREYGKPPVMRALARCGDFDWQAAERFFISSAKYLGARLTNSTSGGEGVKDPSPESRARLSASLKITYAQPGYIDGIRRKALAAWSRPDIREKQIAALKAAMARPETKANFRAGRNKPEVQVKLRASLKAAWQDESVRARRIDGIRAKCCVPGFYAERGKKTKERFADPEFRKKHSEAVSKSLSTPEQRERKSSFGKARFSDPIVRAAHSMAMREAQSRPEVKAHRAELSKEMWLRQDVRDKICASQKTTWTSADFQERMDNRPQSVGVVIDGSFVPIREVARREGSKDKKVVGRRYKRHGLLITRGEYESSILR